MRNKRCINVNLTGNSGANSAWAIADPDGTILALPVAPPFDLENAGVGVCQIYHVGYEMITGLMEGANINNLQGCFGLSNALTVFRNEVIGGMLTTTSGLTDLTICAGDGNADPFNVILSGNVGENSGWVITDEFGLILALPDNPPFDLEGAGDGVCLVRNISYGTNLSGLEVGNNVDSDLTGCFELSTPITVHRNGVAGGSLTTEDGETALNICAGDGISDAFQVTLIGNTGVNSAWIITDNDLNIIGLPTAPPFDLEGAGAGICLLWYLSFIDGTTAPTMGLNIGDLAGCHAFSNPITINRSESVGGALTIAGGATEISICAGDGNSDAFDVSLSGNSGELSSWVITDDAGVILALPAAPPFDLEGAGGGICQVWNLSHSGFTSGIALGNNINSDISGCYEFSNPITVNRTGVNGGNLQTIDGQTEFTICVDDGISDAFDVTLTGNEGANSAWLITDLELNILATPAAPPFDLEAAGIGTCQVWNLSYDDGLVGADVGLNAADLVGCYALSNPISVIRTKSVGGTLEMDGGGTAIEICAGDGASDAFDVTLTGAEGQMSGWIITDEAGEILALPAAPPFDLEGAGGGVCSVYHVSSSTLTTGIAIGNNINTDIAGCYELSNAIVVTRIGVGGGQLTTQDGNTDLTICAGDGIGDPIEILLIEETGDNSAWVITDTDLNILAIPAAPPFDLEGAGVGVCQIWHLSYGDGLTGLAVDENTTNLAGCFSLSNPITVTRTLSIGGTLEIAGGGTSISICAGDGVADPFDVTLAGNEGQFSGWVITDTDGTILALPGAPPFDLDGAGGGTCLLNHISYSNLTTGLMVGNNVLADLTGCFELSNTITVERTGVSGGSMTTTDGETELTICAGDGQSDAFDVTLLDTEPTANAAWVITDESGIILALPETGPFDLEGAGEGVCQLWNLNYANGLTGLEVDQNVADLEGCYDFSNPITVTRLATSPPCATAVTDLLEGEQLSIYPNPAHDELEINFASEAKQEASLELISALGIKAISERRLSTGGSMTLEVAALPRGVYFVKINIGERELVRMVVLE